MRIILTYTLTNCSLRIVDPYLIANFEVRQLVQYREQFSVGTLDFRHGYQVTLLHQFEGALLPFPNNVEIQQLVLFFARMPLDHAFVDYGHWQSRHAP